MLPPPWCPVRAQGAPPCCAGVCPAAKQGQIFLLDTVPTAQGVGKRHRAECRGFPPHSHLLGTRKWWNSELSQCHKVFALISYVFLWLFFIAFSFQWTEQRKSRAGAHLCTHCLPKWGISTAPQGGDPHPGFPLLLKGWSSSCNPTALYGGDPHSGIPLLLKGVILILDSHSSLKGWFSSWISAAPQGADPHPGVELWV